MKSIEKHLPLLIGLLGISVDIFSNEIRIFLGKVFSYPDIILKLFVILAFTLMIFMVYTLHKKLENQMLKNKELENKITEQRDKMEGYISQLENKIEEYISQEKILNAQLTLSEEKIKNVMSEVKVYNHIRAHINSVENPNVGYLKKIIDEQKNALIPKHYIFDEIRLTANILDADEPECERLDILYVWEFTGKKVTAVSNDKWIDIDIASNDIIEPDKIKLEIKRQIDNGEIIILNEGNEGFSYDTRNSSEKKKRILINLGHLSKNEEFKLIISYTLHRNYKIKGDSFIVNPITFARAKCITFFMKICSDKKLFRKAVLKCINSDGSAYDELKSHTNELINNIWQVSFNIPCNEYHTEDFIIDTRIQ